MEEFYINMAISVVLTVIKQSVKNPNSKAKLKAALKKVRDSINLLYADDADFQ